MAADRKKRKEEAFLSRTQLCTFNFSYKCRYGSHCNYAHTLNELMLPEERMGNCSDVWQKGNADINFWDNYIPNEDSLTRFSKQFLWEYNGPDWRNPHWAWGHAVKLGDHRCLPCARLLPSRLRLA